MTSNSQDHPNLYQLDEKLPNPTPFSLLTAPTNTGYFTLLTEQFLSLKQINHSTFSISTLTIHSKFIKSLILLKAIAAVLFFLSFSRHEPTFFILILTFEPFGYRGSTTLQQFPNLVFISYLALSTLLRFSISMNCSAIRNEVYCVEGKYFNGAECESLKNYITGSIFFILLQVGQIYLSLRLLKQSLNFTQRTTELMEFVLRNKKTSLLDCLRTPSSPPLLV